jgi:hypothetical protein
MLASGRLERQAATHTYLRPCLSELATGWTHVPCHILSRFKNDLELHTVGISKEHRVVAGRVGILSRSAKDFGAYATEVGIKILNVLATRHVEGQVIETGRMAIISPLDAIRLGLEQGHRKEVPLRSEDEPSGWSRGSGSGRAFVSDPREDLIIEGNGPAKIGDRQIDVTEEARLHVCLPIWLTPRSAAEASNASPGPRQRMVRLNVDPSPPSLQGEDGPPAYFANFRKC